MDATTYTTDTSTLKLWYHTLKLRHHSTWYGVVYMSPVPDNGAGPPACPLAIAPSDGGGDGERQAGSQCHKWHQWWDSDMFMTLSLPLFGPGFLISGFLDFMCNFLVFLGSEKCGDHLSRGKIQFWINCTCSHVLIPTHLWVIDTCSLF